MADAFDTDALGARGLLHGEHVVSTLRTGERVAVHVVAALGQLGRDERAILAGAIAARDLRTRLFALGAEIERSLVFALLPDAHTGWLFELEGMDAVGSLGAAGAASTELIGR